MMDDSTKGTLITLEVALIEVFAVLDKKYWLCLDQELTKADERLKSLNKEAAFALRWVHARFSYLIPKVRENPDFTSDNLDRIIRDYYPF